MNGTITLTKAALVSLLDAVLNPNPDDPGNPNDPWGPYGPFGPVIRGWSSVALNPRPLPPMAGPVPDPWRAGPGPQPWRAGPRPEPWRAALLARAVIGRAVTQYQFAEVLVGTQHAARMIEAVGSQIHEFVDDYCGTGPRRWPWPWPWPPTFEPPQRRPLELLVAAAQFQKAADVGVDSPLQAEFSAAADRLFETGLREMQAE
jgi:hypothetical protein